MGNEKRIINKLTQKTV